jgi:SPP1 gp7 family putative phage head morphogenesis protein
MGVAKKEKTLPPVHPNCGVEMDFRRRLLKIIRQMNADVTQTLSVAFRADPPTITANDADPADALRRAMADLSKRWTARFDEAAEELAAYFAQAASQRTDTALKAILRKAGISIKFKLTAAQRDILKATVNESVALIRNLPDQYLTSVNTAVMQSVKTGRDLGGLTDELAKIHGISRRRAATISRDQNNKASGALTRARFIELGIVEAVWKHSHGGRVPRPAHVAMDGKKFNVKEGMYDSKEDRNVHPGELINCRCTSRPIIPSLS